jgi:hypothetical protein
MAFLPKFLREFPENVPTVVEDDLMPISRANEDDSYKITTQKLRDDVLGQRLVGIKKPYIYGDSHYTAGVGSIMHSPLHGDRAITCSDSLDFDAIMPGYLLHVEVTFGVFEYRTVIKKNYTQQYLIVDSSVVGWPASISFEYSDPRFVVGSTTSDTWRPVTGESTLRGLIHEHTYFDYEPVDSHHIFVSGLSEHIPLPIGLYVKLHLDTVEWNGFGEWNQTDSTFTPVYDGLYSFDVIFTIEVYNYNPGTFFLAILAPDPLPGTLSPKISYVYVYPSVLSQYVSINVSSMAVMTAGEPYAWWLYSSAQGAFVRSEDFFPATISIKRERSTIGR